MNHIISTIVIAVNWPAIFYLVVSVLVVTFFQKVLGITIYDLITHLFHELVVLATQINSRESLNALTLLIILSLVVLFFGSHIAREASEIIKIFSGGIEGHTQSIIAGISSAVVIAVVGLLSVAATRH